MCYNILYVDIDYWGKKVLFNEGVLGSWLFIWKDNNKFGFILLYIQKLGLRGKMKSEILKFLEKNKLYIFGFLVQKEVFK